jgi:hypothetical protein
MTDEVELSDEDLALGGYRFEDLQELRIVENRTDLQRKQDELGFPKPVKTGKSQALFLKVEVHTWLRQRVALRDASIQSVPAGLLAAPIQVQHSADVPIKSASPPPPKARPKKLDRQRARKTAKG